MGQREMPQVSSSTYTTTSMPVGMLFEGSSAAPQYFVGNNGVWPDDSSYVRQNKALLQAAVEQARERNKEMGRRIVQVFIADTDENVPLEKSVIYTGQQKLTDSTDQELFFEIDIKTLLDNHNAYRVTLINKKVKERTENLDPVKIRDLKMVVVNVAEFK
jgi:hypothetical protein